MDEQTGGLYSKAAESMRKVEQPAVRESTAMHSEVDANRCALILGGNGCQFDIRFRGISSSALGPISQHVSFTWPSCTWQGRLIASVCGGERHEPALSCYHYVY